MPQRKIRSSSQVSCANGGSRLDQVSRYFEWKLKKVKVMSKLNDIAVPYSKKDPKENNNFVPKYDLSTNILAADYLRLIAIFLGLPSDYD